MKKAVYAGSFDPVTNGHMYIIQQGARLFDYLIVAVGSNPDKRYQFSIEERTAMLVECTREIQNVEVSRFDDEYLVCYASRMGATHLLRGIRNEYDYQFERTLRNVNEDIHAGVISIYLMPPRGLSEVSSSFVKGLVGPNGWEEVVARYVPAPVLNRLRRIHKGKG